MTESQSQMMTESQSQSTKVKNTIVDDQGSRLIFGLMAFAVGFSLLGNELKAVTQPQTGTSGVVTTAGKIILGGFFATSILVLVSHAGDPGRQVGVGLATVAVLSSTLINGKAVWDGANKLFGSQPTKPLSNNPTATTIANDTTLATGLTPRTAATAAAG